MQEATLHKFIQKQDPKSYEYLMDKYSKLLWVVVSGVLKGAGSNEDIEDCIAECFIYLWENPKKYDPNRGTIKTYLCLLARSKAIDKLRKINKVAFIPYDDSLENVSFDLESDFLKKEEIKEVLEITNELKPIDKRIFLLRYFYEIKPKEIASIVGMGVKEVSNKLYNSRKYLSNKLGGN